MSLGCHFDPISVRFFMDDLVLEGPHDVAYSSFHIITVIW